MEYGEFHEAHLRKISARAQAQFLSKQKYALILGFQQLAVRIVGAVDCRGESGVLFDCGGIIFQSFKRIIGCKKQSTRLSGKRGHGKVVRWPLGTTHSGDERAFRLLVNHAGLAGL
jgi:hypothetical protein